MKLHGKVLALLLALCLCAGGLTALAAGLENPESYLGDWGGGDDYGEAREYYLHLLDLKDDVFNASLDIYRIWAFDGMIALLTPDSPSAVLSTGSFDEYSVMGTLDFSEDGIALLILESDCPDLPAGTAIDFERVVLE